MVRAQMAEHTWADETKTGRWATRRRGLRQATVVARADAADGFEWLEAFKRDFLPPGAEAKSTTVLPILDLQPRAYRLVLKHVERYAIFIVDLHEYRRQLLDGLVTRLRRVIPAGVDPYEFILALPYPGFNIAERIREIALADSVLGRVETLLEFATNPFAGIAGSHRDELAAYMGGPKPVLLNRAELGRLGDRQVGMLLGRLGVAVGDALSPKRQAAALLESFTDHRYFQGRYFAYRVLSLSVAADRTYDVGDANVMLQLDRAHSRICGFVERHSGRALRRGLLDQRTSHSELGIQAADVAAALASRLYESQPEDGRRDAAEVRRVFGDVLLNGHWL